jgi:hypothetical protein
MKIYKIIKAQINEYDLGEMVDNQVKSIMNEFYSQSHSMGSKMSWSVIPFAKLKRIWEDYSTYGFVRNEKGLEEIKEKILKNLTRLEASTMLSGHTPMSMEELSEAGEFEPINEEENPELANDFYWNFLNTEYGSPISDYALKPLWDLAFKLIKTTNHEEMLLLIDRMLNICHMRGDLASLFVEGGSAALSELSAK